MHATHACGLRRTVPTMKKSAIRWIAQAAICVALAATGTAALHAQDDSGAPPQGQGRGGGAGRGRGVRGTVVSASGSNVVLKTETGESWTVVATDNTRVNIDRQPVKLAELKAGDEVIAMGMPDDAKHEIHAMMIAGASAAQVARLRADLGKTYIVGKITAVNDTKLTVLRADKVSQTITLDDSTSLKRGGRLPAEFTTIGVGGGFGGGGGGNRRREGTPNETSGGNPNSADGGESITLADVKIGDNIAGMGSVKSGFFVPTELHVNTPRPRPARGDGNVPAGPPPQH